MNLANRVVLVTGATGGLGQEFVTQSLAAAPPRSTPAPGATTTGQTPGSSRSGST